MNDKCVEIEERVEQMRVYMVDNPFNFYAYEKTARCFGDDLDGCGVGVALKRDAGESDSVFRSRIMDAIVAKHEKELNTMRSIPGWGGD